MSYELSEKTKRNLEKSIGLPFEEMIKMSDDELQSYIENKIGKKIKWPEGAKVDGLPIVTMEEVDRRINKILNIKDKGER